jgi:salicylate hydroxylase
MAVRAEQLHVLVVGAGMAGLGAALAIRHAGHKVTVLEQAAEFGEVCITAHLIDIAIKIRM